MNGFEGRRGLPVRQALDRRRDPCASSVAKRTPFELAGTSGVRPTVPVGDAVSTSTASVGSSAETQAYSGAEVSKVEASVEAIVNPTNVEDERESLRNAEAECRREARSRNEEATRRQTQDDTAPEGDRRSPQGRPR